MLKPNQRLIVLPIHQVTSLVKKRDQTSSSGSTEKQKTRLDFGWVSLFTLSITVFTAIVFGAGKAYRQHYLALFDFTDAVIPWPFQDVVYLGVTKQLTILMAAPMWAIGALFGWVVLIGVWLWIRNRLAAKRTKKTGNRKEVNSISSTDSLLETIQFLLNCLISASLISLLALLFVASAESLGGTDAKAAIISVAQGNQEKPKLSYVTIERIVGGQRIIEAGYLVSCSEHICGLYSPDKGDEASRLVPLDSVTSFRYKD